HPTGGYPVIAGTCFVQEFAFPPPDFDELRMFVGAGGPGIRPDCPSWSTGTKEITLRREGYEPTPTPTPEPTPCEPACKCMPIPSFRCDETTPTRSAVGVPPGSLILEFEPPYPGDPEGELLGLRGMPDSWNYQWHEPH